MGVAFAVVLCGMAILLTGGDSVVDTLSRWTGYNPDLHQCRTGAWGHLWYERSVVEIPPDRIKVLTFQPRVTQWYVEADSSAGLVSCLRSCGLQPSQIDELMLTMTRATNKTGRLLTPKPELILSLDAEVRLKLYTMLGRYGENSAQMWPFRFSGAPDDNWFEGVKLEPEVEKMVKSLLYRQGQSLMFSDLDLVMSRFPSVTTYTNLFQAVSRESTLVARLRLEHDDDIDLLARYWGVPNRQDDVRTLLKTMQMTENCRDVPVGMLLPGFVRNRLYRYWHEGDPEFASCHYTAMNFLNQRPDAGFTNLAVVAQVLARDYVEVKGDYRLGDVILLMKNDTEAIHSCNYIADGVVFTRNGGSYAQPWMLTTLPALVDFYSYPDPVHLKVLRRRDVACL